MEEKIKAPQFEEDRRKEAARRDAVQKGKAALADEQRRVLDEDASAPFKYRMPLDYRQHFTAEEISELETAEEIAYNRHAPIAREKADSRRAWASAGGSEESFERNWSEFGEEASVMERAGGMSERYTSAY